MVDALPYQTNNQTNQPTKRPTDYEPNHTMAHTVHSPIHSGRLEFQGLGNNPSVPWLFCLCYGLGSEEILLTPKERLETAPWWKNYCDPFLSRRHAACSRSLLRSDPCRFFVSSDFIGSKPTEDASCGCIIVGRLLRFIGFHRIKAGMRLIHSSCGHRHEADSFVKPLGICSLGSCRLATARIVDTNPYGS